MCSICENIIENVSEKCYYQFVGNVSKESEYHTGNGNTVVANGDITWTTVSLPK